MPLNPPQAYRKTNYTHRIGLAAARPAATDVLPGTLYYSTDTNVLERSNGATWVTYTNLGIVGPYLVIDQDALVNAGLDGVTIKMDGPSQGSSYRFRYGLLDYGGLFSTLDSGLFLNARAGVPILMMINTYPHFTMTAVGEIYLKKDQVAAFTLGASQMWALQDTTGNNGTRIELAMGYRGGTYFPALMGYIITDGSGQTNGSMYFATRALTTDSPPIVRLNIASSGAVTITNSLAWGGGAIIASSNDVAAALGSALSVWGVTGNAGANNASIVAASDGQVLRRSGTSVAFGALDLSVAAAITGDLPDANLSANVPLLNATNIFTGAQQRIGNGTAQSALVLDGDSAAAAGAVLYYQIDTVTKHLIGTHSAIFGSGTLLDLCLYTNVASLPLRLFSGGVEGINITDGLVSLPTGQLQFPATQNPSSNVNTLDDYEEGTWTPVDSSGAGLALTGVAGSYTKTGNTVFWNCLATYPATASGAVFRLGGLPFTVGGFFTGAAVGLVSVAPPFDYVPITGTTYIESRARTTAAVGTNAQHSTAVMIFSGAYPV